MPYPGTPSDEVAGVLNAGRGDITTLFVSMAARHPDGADAEYLRWHTMYYRPEQQRLSAVRASLRLVSTPACRSTRAASREPYGDIDHVMTYFLSDPRGMTAFLELSKALSDAGRKLPLLPPVERGVYRVEDKAATPRVKIGADVLPWWPARGVYMLLEASAPAPIRLTEVDGVAGVWSALSQPVDARLANAPAGQTITYCFLDEDPVGIAERLRPVLEKRWSDNGIEPLFAAPFHAVVPNDWDRYEP
jgi:hypothetical protein